MTRCVRAGIRPGIVGYHDKHMVLSDVLATSIFDERAGIDLTNDFVTPTLCLDQTREEDKKSLPCNMSNYLATSSLVTDSFARF
jgi:hypothetical protein